MDELGEPRRWGVLGAIFLVSFAVLAFQVSLTRIFSVVFSYHFAFLIVSGAICGLGLGGLGWYLGATRARSRPPEAGWMAVAFGLALPASVAALFAAPSLLSTSLWAAAIPLLPFAFAGAFLAEVFRRRAAESGYLYQADLAGASLAAVLVIPLISLTGALDLSFPLGALAALAGAAYAAGRRQPRLLSTGLAAAALLLACWPLSVRGGWLALRPLRAESPRSKSMLQALDDGDMVARIIDTHWSAYARTDLVRCDLPEAGVYSLQLYTDGGTPSLMLPFSGDLQAMAYLREWLPYLAFDSGPRGRMLSIGPGGGVDLLWGLLAGFREIDGVEVSEGCARMMDRYSRINGGLYRRPGVRVVVGDGRSFLRRSKTKYDLIICSLTQTATTGNVGQSLVESYIHTKEAFGDYLDHLTPDGRYALVAETEEVLLKGVFTALAVMAERGTAPSQACRHIIALSLPQGEADWTPYCFLLIWHRSPVNERQLASVRAAVAAGQAKVLFAPGLDRHPLLGAVARGEAVPEGVFEAGLTGPPRVDLRPATDERPFFLDLSVGPPSVAVWLVVLSVGVAAVFAGTVMSRRRPEARGIGGWLTYFSALGAGFMLVEIPLIQKAILFLGHPTISYAAVVCFLLIGASLGSRLSQRWPPARLRMCVAVAAAAVAVVGAGYAGGLTHLLDRLIGWPQPARLLLLGLLLVPLGGALGVPFPSGIRLMSARHAAEIPWMWGTNGLLSVTGSALAAASAKLVGIDGCLLAAAGLYAVVAFGIMWFTRSERAGAEAATRRGSQR
ncbi:MAG: hypothetical protein ACE149_10525 [Armatimonadota bacterium]